MRYYFDGEEKFTDDGSQSDDEEPNEEDNDDNIDETYPEEGKEDEKDTKKKRKRQLSKGSAKTKSSLGLGRLMTLSLYSDDFQISDLERVQSMVQCLAIIIRVYLAMAERIDPTKKTIASSSGSNSAIVTDWHTMVMIPEELLERTLFLLHSLLSNNFGDPTSSKLLGSSSSSGGGGSEKKTPSSTTATTTGTTATTAGTPAVKTEKSTHDPTTAVVNNKKLMNYLVSYFLIYCDFID